jgi:hypothetical protein
MTTAILSTNVDDELSKVSHGLLIVGQDGGSSDAVDCGGISVLEAWHVGRPIGPVPPDALIVWAVLAIISASFRRVP